MKVSNLAYHEAAHTIVSLLFFRSVESVRIRLSDGTGVALCGYYPHKKPSTVEDNQQLLINVLISLAGCAGELFSGTFVYDKNSEELTTSGFDLEDAKEDLKLMSCSFSVDVYTYLFEQIIQLLGCFTIEFNQIAQDLQRRKYLGKTYIDRLAKGERFVDKQAELLNSNWLNCTLIEVLKLENINLQHKGKEDGTD